jgi:limonene-1,2-epoxide hydrolase
MTPTPEEIFEHHAAAVNAADLDAMVHDYAEDAVVMSPDGVVRGREAVRSLLAGALSALPDGSFEAVTQVYSEDALLLRWRADSAANVVPDGIDTFIFADGKIRLHTMTFSVVPKGTTAALPDGIASSG